MQATQPRPPAPQNDQAFFLTAYRDHLLTELAEVQRRLAECEAAPAAARTKGTGLEY